MKLRLKKTFSFGLIIGLLASGHVLAACRDEQAAQEIKRNIITQAEAWTGEGDPDRSKQAVLDVQIDRLLSICPQPDVSDRLPLIQGAWKQVWGPYTYRDSKRGVDPRLDPDNIYQVIFPAGYYYNISPARDANGQPKNYTTLLRGEYGRKSKKVDKNTLAIHFTNLRSVPNPLPDGVSYHQLPEFVEAGRVSHSTRLPSLFVRLFFGGGFLREVYTDENLRITYGSKEHRFKKDNLYILKRVQ